MPPSGWPAQGPGPGPEQENEHESGGLSQSEQEDEHESGGLSQSEQENEHESGGLSSSKTGSFQVAVISLGQSVTVLLPLGVSSLIGQPVQRMSLGDVSARIRPRLEALVDSIERIGGGHRMLLP